MKIVARRYSESFLSLWVDGLKRGELTHCGGRRARYYLEIDGKKVVTRTADVFTVQTAKAVARQYLEGTLPC